MQYEPKTFTFPTLEGISQKTMDEHIGLYQGYVKNFNALTELMDELFKESDKNVHALSEAIRRRSFEFGGMRLHEYYFPQLEGGPAPLDSTGKLGKALAEQFGSIDEAIRQIKIAGMLRGPGWSILYFDPQASAFRIGFTGEQHQGHFVTLPIVLALDVWEHAFILDQGAQGKGKYIDAFFKNLNWSVVEKHFEEATK
ncbi:MAG: Fe-Mn family superoxide dismutase [Candidatus Pacebacteria bacterium]|nr:Fe-Mn family superoxide dismutase [Candidatus Paceibacterota bacterium]